MIDEISMNSGVIDKFFGETLDSTGCVDRISDMGVVHSSGSANISGHDTPRMKPNAYAKRLLPSRRSLLIELLQPAEHS